MTFILLLSFDGGTSIGSSSFYFRITEPGTSDIRVVMTTVSASQFHQDDLRLAGPGPAAWLDRAGHATSPAGRPDIRMGDRPPIPVHPSTHPPDTGGIPVQGSPFTTSPAGDILPCWTSLPHRFRTQESFPNVCICGFQWISYSTISHISVKNPYISKTALFPNIGKTPLYENTYFLGYLQKTPNSVFWRFLAFL